MGKVEDVRMSRISDRVGDETVAEALRIAERRLTALGWRFSHEDVGKTAARIIAALDAAAIRKGSD